MFKKFAERLDRLHNEKYNCIWGNIPKLGDLREAINQAKEDARVEGSVDTDGSVTQVGEES